MRSHTPYGNNSIICMNYNKKYTLSIHNMMSLAAMPRIPQLLSLRKTTGPKRRRRDQIEVYLVGNEDRFHILAENQKNTDRNQYFVHNPIISFSLCNKIFGVIAIIVQSQQEAKRTVNQITGLYIENRGGVKGRLSSLHQNLLL
jgi:hypothetical protein